MKYLAMWGVEGSLRDTPSVWFAREFLAWPTPHWNVDWSTACCPSINGELGDPPNPYDIVERHDPALCLVGARVIFDNGSGTRLIWVLTGAYDAAKRGHMGRWPD